MLSQATAIASIEECRRLLTQIPDISSCEDQKKNALFQLAFKENHTRVGFTRQLHDDATPRTVFRSLCDLAGRTTGVGRLVTTISISTVFHTYFNALLSQESVAIAFCYPCTKQSAAISLTLSGQRTVDFARF